MDLKAISQKGLEGVTKLFVKDLQALPESAYEKRFSDKTRTIADIVYEVNLVTDHVGMVLRGEEPFEWPEEGWIKAPEDFRSKEDVIKGFETSMNRTLETLIGFSSEDLAGTITTENGETTRFQRFQFIMIHCWYHLGQLNYVQTLLGDDEWHWK